MNIELKDIFDNRNFQLILGPILLLLVIYIVYAAYKFIKRVLLSGKLLIKTPFRANSDPSQRDLIAMAKKMNPLTFYNSDVKETLGNDYTYSFWMNINDMNYRYGNIKHVLTKGGAINSDGDNYETMNPGIWLHPTEPSLIFKFDHYGRLYNQSHTGGSNPSICQDWSSQSPTQHNFRPSSFPEKHLEKNYCRNPGSPSFNGEGAPGSNSDGNAWCYTLDGSASDCLRDSKNFKYTDRVTMKPPGMSTDVVNDELKAKKNSMNNNSTNYDIVSINENTLNDWISSDSIVIRNIALQNWNFIVVIMENQTVDVYINGKLTKSLKLPSPSFVNNKDLVVADEGGFDGYINQLTVYDRALSPDEVMALFLKGNDDSSSWEQQLKGLLPRIDYKISWDAINLGKIGNSSRR